MSKASPHARFAFNPTELRYNFGEHHPLQSSRVAALVDLLQSSGLLDLQSEELGLPVRPATLDELRLAHTQDYIDAVQTLSSPLAEGADEEARIRRANLELNYGFGDGDTPVLPDMHQVVSYIAGGSLVALSTVLGLPGGLPFAEDERPQHVFHPGGGLHHAWAGRASGFCIYNDASIAIAHALQSSELKVLYIDFDAHHGDGVQRSFYDESRVMTISFHETGRYLFPGTGDVLELGNGLGRGYSVNVPLEPYTQDGSYIEVIETLLPPLLLSFGPDVIISNHGCDTHAWDPLTHLELTTRGMQAQYRLTHQLAHTYCQGRWVALGGGGYDPYRVVPRSWGLLWAEMSEQELPAQLPEAWIERWRPAWYEMEARELAAQQVMGKAPQETDFPLTFLDRAEDFPALPRQWSITKANQHTVSLVRHLVVPPSVRSAFPSSRQHSPLTGLFDLLHLQGSATPSRSRVLETSREPVLMRDFCPPSLVERLRAAPGLISFARVPEREHELLLGISRRPDCALTLAHTTAGEIIGEVTLAPGDAWWDGLENVYEVAIEVSNEWRGLGIARSLLSFSLELDALEDMIFFAVGLSWHWDTEKTGLSIYRYREMLAHLFGTQGFKEYPTTEPNISMEPANIMLARVGKRVDQRAAGQFFNRMLSSPNMPGF